MSTNETASLFFSYRSIYKINIDNLTCTCRFFLAYSSCPHKHMAIQLFDVQDPSNKFCFRAKKGRPDKQAKACSSEIVSAQPSSIFSPVQLIKINTHLSAYHNFLYLNLSSELINTAQHDRLPLCKQIYKKPFEWSTFFDSIPDCLINKFLKAPTLYASSNTLVLTDTKTDSTAAAKNEPSIVFQSQLTNQLNILKPPKALKAVKTSKAFGERRSAVLSQLATWDDVNATTSQVVVKKPVGRPKKVVDENAEPKKGPGGGPGRQAKAKSALKHQ